MNSDKWIVRFIYATVGFVLGAIVATVVICFVIMADGQEQTQQSMYPPLSSYPGQVIA